MGYNDSMLPVKERVEPGGGL